ncbi:hypothetical protein V5O48_006582 [Marasmius crinis-equi]|uniref:Uncharacterized protein n=1 Tax=Marasmius crinis-equi TaxID=585013 RepID=A0ABR3FJH2_9AGAR
MMKHARRIKHLTIDGLNCEAFKPTKSEHMDFPLLETFDLGENLDNRIAKKFKAALEKAPKPANVIMHEFAEHDQYQPSGTKTPLPLPYHQLESLVIGEMTEQVHLMNHLSSALHLKKLIVKQCDPWRGLRVDPFAISNLESFSFDSRGHPLRCSGMFASLTFPSLKSFQFSSWVVGRDSVFGGVAGEWPCQSFLSFLQRSTQLDCFTLRVPKLQLLSGEGLTRLLEAAPNLRKVVLVLKDDDDSHSFHASLASSLAISPGSTILVPHLARLSVSFREPITMPDQNIVQQSIESRAEERLEELGRKRNVSPLKVKFKYNDKMPIPNERRVGRMGELLR